MHSSASSQIFHSIDAQKIDKSQVQKTEKYPKVLACCVDGDYYLVDGYNGKFSVILYNRQKAEKDIFPGIKIKGVGRISSADFYHLYASLDEKESRPENEVRSEAQENIDKLLSQAVTVGASDIHIKREDKVAHVFYRINGQVHQYESLDQEECDKLVFVLYNVLASTKGTTWNPDLPQDANIIRTYNETTYRFRYAHMPIFGQTRGCYHAVMRIIKTESVRDIRHVDLETYNPLKPMKFNDAELELLVKMMKQPYGLLLICGVTGSGKSTTMKGVMEWMYFLKYHGKGTFITVEDPVEYYIEGAIQSSVVRRDEESDPFTPALKSAMRRDPDIIMLGEMRDHTTAKAMVGAVESGHFCVTTVHSGAAVNAIHRLESLGIEGSRLSAPGFISGIIAQSLIPKLCDECKVQEGEIEGVLLYRASEQGCSKCRKSGIAGRCMVPEMWYPDSNDLRFMSSGSLSDIYENWRTRRDTSVCQGFSIKEKAYFHVLKGNSDHQWFSSHFGEVDPDSQRYLIDAIKAI